MATASRQQPDPRPDVIVLTISLQEARTLKQLFQYIGGDPNKSARLHTDSMNRALIMAQVISADHPLIGKPDFFFDDVERSTL